MLVVLGINRVLNWCQILCNGRKYTCPTKIIEGELYFSFKNKWHSVAEFSDSSTEVLLSEIHFHTS